jgi:hypothetical protein
MGFCSSERVKERFGLLDLGCTGIPLILAENFPEKVVVFS